jgi:hypothetical protein
VASPGASPRSSEPPDGPGEPPEGRGSPLPRLSPRLRSALLWAAFGWIAGLARLRDNSFLTHLRTGDRILDHGIPRHDLYSYTVPDAPWTAQSWLVEVLYAGLDRTTGLVGIQLLHAATGAAIACLVFLLADRVSGGARTSPLVLPAVFASSLFWVERPLHFGILAFLALIWIVEVPESWPGRRPLVWVPVLMCLWVNAHGTFALGFAYLGLHLAGRWLDGHPPWRGRESALVRAAAVGLLACLANPFGAELVLFPADLLAKGDALKHVQEWMSPDFRTPTGMAFAVWIAVFAALVALARERPSRRDLLVGVAFLLLSLWALRNIAIAPLAGLPIAVRLLPARPRGPAVPRHARRNLAAVSAVLLLAALLTRQTLAKPPLDLSDYPVTAMRAVEREGLLGRRLFTLETWSAYVIHAYWPRQRVFVDDRFDMYPVPFTTDYMAIRDGDERWKRVFDRYRVEVVVWKTGTALAEILARDPGWRPVHRDRQATVLVRR